MTMGHLLQKVNSELRAGELHIDRHTVAYYVRQGFLNPDRIDSKRGRVRRCDFGEEDFRVAQIMWKYQLQGIAPRKAFERAQMEKDQAELPLTIY